MDRWPVTNFSINLPNPAGAGNALILGIQFQNAVAVSSITDNEGNTWVTGPTAVNGNTSQQMSLYYALNARAGTQNIVVHFSGSTTVSAFPQAVISEFDHVATISALDGSSSNANSRTAGTITTTASGDLIYHWGVDFSDTDSNGGNYNGSSISAGSGFTLLSADLQVGSADQYAVQTGSGAITPTFGASGSATWGSLALALKSASAGTPPATGIHIVHIQHTLLAATRAQSRSTPVVMQFPSSGNLLVGLYTSPDVTITGVTDNQGNLWNAPASALSLPDNVAQIVYAASASTGLSLGSIKVSLNGTTSGDVTFDLYDVAGAAENPFDKATIALGNQTSGGNLTTATITPAKANGLVLTVCAIDFHTINGIVGAGEVLDSVVNAFDDNDPSNGGTDTSTLDEDNGYAHLYNTTTNPVTFVYTYTNPQNGGVQLWGAVAASFEAP
jgi:hypothetical protein